MAEVLHTKTPWKVIKLGAADKLPAQYGIWGGDGWNLVCLWTAVGDANNGANADRIVECVNSHDELVEEKADLVKAKEIAIDALGELKELVKRLAPGDAKDEMGLTIDDALSALEGTQK